MEFKGELYRLRLFNERAEEIGQSRFSKDLPKYGRLFVGLRSTENGVLEERNIPDVDAVKAFLLDLRKFIQKRDPYCFEKMKTAYRLLPISKETKDQFSRTMEDYNKYMRIKATFEIGDETITYGDVLDTVLYGRYAHEKGKKKQRYERWMRSMQMFRIAVEAEFVFILVWILSVIQYVAKINKRALEELEGRPK